MHLMRLLCVASAGAAYGCAAPAAARPRLQPREYWTGAGEHSADLLSAVGFLLVGLGFLPGVARAPKTVGAWWVESRGTPALDLDAPPASDTRPPPPHRVAYSSPRPACGAPADSVSRGALTEFQELNIRTESNGSICLDDTRGSAPRITLVRRTLPPVA